jgi:hypothetical protein
VDASERLEAARNRAADRLEAIMGRGEAWAMFDESLIALVFSGHDLLAPDIIETADSVAGPYSEQLVTSAIDVWTKAFHDPASAVEQGHRFGALASSSVQGAVMIGLLIGLMAAESEATSE